MSISMQNHENRIVKLESLEGKMIVPDVSQVAEVTTSPYTVATAGFVSFCTSESYGQGCYFTLNGWRMFGTLSYTGGTYYANMNILVPVIPNDVITFKGLNTTVNGVKGSLYFYPAKTI